jgi:4-alpha-glucanotransferase
VIAEDLGTISADVRELLRQLELPGMKVLLFAFGSDASHPYLPHNHPVRCVAYTGTHDNNTARGWFEEEASAEERTRLVRYLGGQVDAAEVHWSLIRLAMSSVAELVIVPVQDVLGLGSESRMNVPGSSQGNWRWRLADGQLSTSVLERWRGLTETYGRCP